jgi:type VI protein secretion system component VasF
MEKKVKGYFASKDPRMDLFLKTVLYLVMCLSGLVEVVGSKNDLQEATINNLRNNVSDYSHALLDSREIKKDIDPNLKGSTKRRKNLKISLNHYMIYIVITIAFLVLFLIYWGSTHNWF